jgi:hypothetical protein
VTDNPSPHGLAGLVFGEFTSPDPDMMAAQVDLLGFVAAARKDGQTSRSIPMRTGREP